MNSAVLKRYSAILFISKRLFSQIGSYSYSQEEEQEDYKFSSKSRIVG